MTIEYKYISLGDDEFKECDCCHAVAPLYAFRRPGIPPSTIDSGLPHEATTDVFCEVCSSTIISSTYIYPGQHAEDGHILQTISAVANILLDKLTDRLKIIR